MFPLAKSAFSVALKRWIYREIGAFLKQSSGPAHDQPISAYFAEMRGNRFGPFQKAPEGLTENSPWVKAA
jgi:hypothetical protein